MEGPSRWDARAACMQRCVAGRGLAWCVGMQLQHSQLRLHLLTCQQRNCSTLHRPRQQRNKQTATGRPPPPLLTASAAASSSDLLDTLASEAAELPP